RPSMSGPCTPSFTRRWSSSVRSSGGLFNRPIDDPRGGNPEMVRYGVAALVGCLYVAGSVWLVRSQGESYRESLRQKPPAAVVAAPPSSNRSPVPIVERGPEDPPFGSTAGTGAPPPAPVTSRAGSADPRPTPPEPTPPPAELTAKPSQTTSPSQPAR